VKRLRPLAKLDARHEKVARHYFRTVEAWWEVSDQTREEWSSDHGVLEAAGVLRPGGWLAVQHLPPVEMALERGHRSWFTAAEQAFHTGEAYRHEETVKRFYVGTGGVLAVVAAPDDDPRLVTAFRPTPPIPGNRVGDSSTRAYLRKTSPGAFVRAAVRRVVRGASR